MPIRRWHFYTCKLFKEFFEVLEVFWGCFFHIVLAETTTGRFSSKKAAQIFGEEKKWGGK